MGIFYLMFSYLCFQRQWTELKKKTKNPLREIYQLDNIRFAMTEG